MTGTPNPFPDVKGRSRWWILLGIATVLVGGHPGTVFAEEELVIESFAVDGGSKELNLHLLRPPGGVAKGVVAISMYGDRGLESDLSQGSGRLGFLIDLARERQFAVVAFGKPGGGWDRNVNSSEMSPRDAAEQDRKMSGLARDWSQAARRLAAKYDLPLEGWLLYGMCGGAQFAHRLALREPRLFRAVHAHYGGSYDTPTAQGRSVLWLVTTRADEPVYVEAQKFYRECVAADYRIILKGVRSDQETLAGTSANLLGSSPLQELSRRFFEYALDHPDALELPAAYVADYVNEFVLPAGEAGWIPKEQKIWLPTRELAEAWGEIQE